MSLTESAEIAPPPAPYTNTPGEASMNVWWQAVTTVSGITGYQLEVRQFPQPWDTAKVPLPSPPRPPPLFRGLD